MVTHGDSSVGSRAARARCHVASDHGCSLVLQQMACTEQSDMSLLAGTRILSIEQFGAAPYGSMFLADMGAEVIKIENAATGGDPARHVGPYLLGAHDSLYFQGWISTSAVW